MVRTSVRLTLDRVHEAHRSFPCIQEDTRLIAPQWGAGAYFCRVRNGTSGICPVAMSTSSRRCFSVLFKWPSPQPPRLLRVVVLAFWILCYEITTTSLKSTYLFPKSLQPQHNLLRHPLEVQKGGHWHAYKASGRTWGGPASLEDIGKQHIYIYVYILAMLYDITFTIICLSHK